MSAPYETSTSTSSGAIYVHYGFADRADFESQTPQRVKDVIVIVVADVAMILDGCSTLTQYKIGYY